MGDAGPSHKYADATGEKKKGADLMMHSQAVQQASPGDEKLAKTKVMKTDGVTGGPRGGHAYTVAPK